MTRCSLRRGNWSVQELQRMRSLLPQRGVIDTAVLLRRTAESVRKKALDLFAVPVRRSAFTADDDLRLRQSWGALELRLIAAMLGRTIPDLQKRALQLRGKLQAGPWTKDEDCALKNFFGTRREEDLVLCLLRSREEIEVAALRLCLSKDKRFARAVQALRRSMPRWSDADVAILREVYPDRDNLAVARVLGRSVVGVANKANQLGLKKSFNVLAQIGRANVAVRYRMNNGDTPLGERSVGE